MVVRLWVLWWQWHCVVWMVQNGLQVSMVDIVLWVWLIVVVGFVAVCQGLGSSSDVSDGVLFDVSDLVVCRDVDLCVDWLSVRCLSGCWG